MKSTVWRSLEIPVCWESLAPDQEQERQWVHQAIHDSWEANSALHLTGWGPCFPRAGGVHIGVAETNPHTQGIGNQLDGVRNGMMLNFTFASWSMSCALDFRRQACIKNIAVHEFGHALGFTHEQNRADAPDWCRAESQGTSGDITITPFDLHSVMNYCNPQWAGDGKLSADDIAGLHSWYGTPNRQTARYDGAWKGRLTYSDPTCVSDSADLAIMGKQVAGTVTTPDGQVVALSAGIDPDSQLQGFQFRFNAKDLVTLHGLLAGGSLTSTDCGCGQYHFTRK